MWVESREGPLSFLGRFLGAAPWAWAWREQGSSFDFRENLDGQPSSRAQDRRSDFRNVVIGQLTLKLRVANGYLDLCVQVLCMSCHALQGLATLQRLR